MKIQLDPQSERLSEYVRSAGPLVRVPEKSDGDLTNQAIMFKLADLYASPLPVLNGVGRAWHERRKLMTALKRDLAKIGPRLQRLKELQAELEVYYEETGTGRLVEGRDLSFQNRAGFIYDLEDSIAKFLGPLCGSGSRLPNPAFERQYVIYLMVAYYRKITSQPRRVFSREIAYLINEVGYYNKDDSMVVDQEGVKDAYKRFKGKRPILASRVDAEPMKYIQPLLRLRSSF